MEYYVHSIDLANDFFKFGGFTLLVHDLNQTSSSIDLKLAILGVFGAALQSNAQLKDQLFKTDFLRQIVVLINNSKDLPILKRSLFVLSVFLRNFALSQKAFVQSYNGIDLLESLLSQDLVLASKAATLLSDIAIETTSNLKNSDLQIYKQIQYDSIILNSHICLKLLGLVQEPLDRITLGTIFESMAGLATICQNDFSANIDLLKDIASRLNSVNDDFILAHLQDISGKLNLRDEL